MFSLLWRYLFKHIDDKRPLEKLPEVEPDFVAFSQPHDSVKVIWFGHSAFLLNFEGQFILVDPILSNSMGPLGLGVKRFQNTLVEAKDLPKIDFVLITHDHYDHLDLDTVREFKKRETKFIVPLGIGSHLERWGIPAERITELGWWKESKLRSLSVTLTPSQHFSGRSFSNRNKTLWGSYVLIGKSQRVFISGDTGYDSHFKEIGEKFGPFDLAFVESGQYNLKWPAAHMFPHESVQAFFDLKAKRYFPVHWGMLALSEHTWYEPIEKIQASADEKRFELVAPRLGETVVIDGSFKTRPWWKDVPREAKASP